MNGDAAFIAGVIERPRLSRILDSTLIRVCVVQGPSGSGKTTLVRSWALQRESEVPVVWISVGGSVGSRRSFWQHVIGNARRLGNLTDPTARLAGDQLGAAADPVRVVIALLADAGPATWVLDAYESLGPLTGEIDADLARVVAALPRLRVIITTRSHTALADHDLATGGVSRVISLSELALTTEEIHELISRHAKVDDMRLARSIARSTHGYALGVRAAVLTLATVGSLPRADSIDWSAVLTTKLASLLPGVDGARFIADTSVPPYFDLDLATSLTACPDTAELLAVLERNGFGRWIPYASGQPVFQYVDAIRDAFHARSASDPQRFRRSSATTAAWLLANEDLDQSLQYAVAGGDYRLAQQVFLELLVTSPESYTTDRFLGPLREVPHDKLWDYPLLAFGLGLALASNPIMRSEAPSAFAISLESPQMPVDLSPDVDAFCSASMKAVALRLVFEFRASAEASLEAVELVDTMAPELRAQLGEHVGTILRQLSYSLLQGGKVDDAMSVMARSAAFCTKVVSRNYSITYAAGASAFAGDLARSKAIQLGIDLGPWPEDLRQSYMNAFGLVADGFTRLDAMDFTGALDVLRESESYIQTAEFWPYLTTISVAARSGLGQGIAEAERVEAELSDATRPPGVGDNIGTEYLVSWLAHAWLLERDAEHAARLLDEQPPDSAYVAATRIALLLAGDDGGALDLAKKLLELPDHTLRTRAATQTVAAVAALRGDDPAFAASLLNAAAVTYETYGPRLHVATLMPQDRQALLTLVGGNDSTSVHRYLDVTSTTLDATRMSHVNLTPRERVVLRALAEHGSTRAMANALVVSPHTIKSQLYTLYRKLGVSSRDAAIELARQAGLLDGEPTS